MVKLIIYEPFWSTIKRKNISTYTLINTYNINSRTLTRMRKNLPLTTTTLNDFCAILDCEIQDIVQYVPGPIILDK
ncbi:MAG: helix-turn-helix domain-containing protein [Oscillospiraceae bacterium]